MGGKKIGMGSEMLIGATSAATTPIGGLLSVEGPGRTKAVVDVTSLDSADQYEEFMAGFKSGGEVTCELAFYSTDANKGVDLLDDGFEASTQYCFLLYAGSTLDDKIKFYAHVQDYGMAIPGRNEMLTRSITLKITGKPTVPVPP